MKRVWQIGVVVRNLERTAAGLMDLFDMKELPLINRVGRKFVSEGCRTVYKGDKKSMASCMTCCFEFENIEIEFIQPCGEEPSEWKNFLDKYGEGIHHLGWKIEDVNEAEKLFQSKGYKEIQSGNWGEGEYHYFDTKQTLGFVIEVLKFYNETN
ncbi:MAG: VOC family protein [Eubacteriales bacterium]|nr:VOC family protein [Eubacteriales bacterium]